MANEQNLIPFTSDQNREEAKKNGRKGGIASGAARRAKREARETAKRVLDFKPDLPPQMLDTMRRMGLRKNVTPDMRYIATLAIMQKAMNPFAELAFLFQREQLPDLFRVDAPHDLVEVFLPLLFSADAALVLREAVDAPERAVPSIPDAFSFAYSQKV